MRPDHQHHRPDQGGKVKAFAVTSKGKLANFPELPPLATELPGFEVGVWHIPLRAENTPADVVGKLQARCKVAIKDPAFLAKMKDLGPKSCRLIARLRWGQRC